MTPSWMQSWTTIFATRMVNGAIAGIALALVVWALLRLAGRQNSRAKFVLWFSTLLGVAFLPLAGLLAAAGTGAAPRVALPESWAMIAVAIWAVVAGILLARVGVGLWELRRIRRDSRPAAPNEGALLLESIAQFGSRRNVELLVSRTLRVPTAVGFFRPAVIFPEWVLAELSTQEQNSVLLHELAHLRRWDDWTNLAQQILKAVFFFHPAVWWIERRLTLEREMACDHFVLSQTDDPHAYAQCLVAVAEKSLFRRGLAMAQAMVGRVRQTSQRVVEILEAKRPASRGWKPGLAAVVILTMASAGEISQMPQLVAFHDVSPQVAGMPASSLEFKSTSLHVTPTLASYSVPKSSVPKSKLVSLSPQRKRASEPVLHVKPEAVPILASLKTDVMIPAPPPMFVVMRSVQFGPQGEFFWSVQIYQLTVFHPAVPTAQKENRAKQI